MTDAIALEGLTKRFGPTSGVFGLDLRVAPGQIFGFLGPNGAGKTTSIRMLLAYLKPDSGRAMILGHDAQQEAVALRHRIGYLPAEFNLYEHMTGHELLGYLARYRAPGALDRAMQLATRLKITLDGKIRHYSKGMKQKVALIQAMMHDPELLILDEPSDGFDPLIQHEFHQLLVEARERGRTVFLSSHILSEVEQLCDRVAIIRAGKLLAVEDVAQLQARKIRMLNVKFDAALDARALSLPNATFRSQHGAQASFAYAGEARELLAALSALPVADFTLEPARLEEVFLGYYEAERR